MAGATTGEREGRGGRTARAARPEDAAPPGAARRRPRLRARPAGDPPAGRARSVRRRRLLTALVLAAVLFLGGAWVVYGTSLFEVRDVRVTGTEVLGAAEVRAAAGVRVGEPLADVDTSAVEQRLRARLPRIERAEVTRSWPNTLRLRITERTPAAVLRDGRRYTEVDRTGTAYATVSAPPEGVPLVRLVRPDAERTAAPARFGRTALLRAAVEVSDDLPDAVRRRTSSVDVRSYDDIQLMLSGGRTVVWGSAENGSEKRKVLTALLKAVPGAKRYDVSAPSSPATKG